jgi:hypothetical protein
MTYREALELVLELAEQNVVEYDDIPEEHKRQMEAIEAVADFIANRLEG